MWKKLALEEIEVSLESTWMEINRRLFDRLSMEEEWKKYRITIFEYTLARYLRERRDNIAIKIEANFYPIFRYR